MRFRLRTLMILLAVGPVILAWGWGEYRDYANRPRYVVVPPYTSISGATNHMSNQLGNAETVIAKMIAEREAKRGDKAP